MSPTLHHGDCLDVLRTMPACSVDAVVTDPPYGLAFMGKRWDYDVPSVEIWAECLRVLKPGGYLLAFAGTRTQHRMAVRIEDAGFEIRDMIAWVYGSGFPKSMDISQRIDLEEQKRWLDVSKALDNLEIATIMEAWKDHSRAASTAGLSFAKSPTATGISMPKSGFVPEPVLLQANQESSDALALVAELSSREARLTSEAEISSAPMLAVASELRNPVRCAERLRKRSNAISTNAGIVQIVVKDWPSESMVGNLKAAEALRIWLGNKPSSRSEATNALCAALADDLKRIILSQLKTFQSFDTTRQTACVFAITATITESMAECLILSTVDTLRKQAIDRAAGAEREVVGSRRLTGTARIKGQAAFGATSGRSEEAYQDGSEINDTLLLTAPATPEAQQWAGWGTALKPALEPITVARKPLAGTVAENVLQWGTGGINVDGCRVACDPADLGDPTRFQSARKGADSWDRQDKGMFDAGRSGGWANGAPTGRWPANLAHDGSDEVVGLFPLQQSGALNRANIKADNKIYGARPRERTGEYAPSSGSAARFFYTAKASRQDRDDGNNHPTVKPTDLMRYLCRLVTPPGGIVLDPFMGSGSTGKAAMLEGFDFIGIERDADSFATAQRRIGRTAAAGHQPSLLEAIA